MLLFFFLNYCADDITFDDVEQHRRYRFSTNELNKAFNLHLKHHTCYLFKCMKGNHLTQCSNLHVKLHLVYLFILTFTFHSPAMVVLTLGTCEKSKLQNN